MEKTFESYVKSQTKNGNTKWVFTGWNPIYKEYEIFCIENKNRGGYFYKTYKWLDGTIEERKYKIR